MKSKGIGTLAIVIIVVVVVAAAASYYLMTRFIGGVSFTLYFKDAVTEQPVSDAMVSISEEYSETGYDITLSMLGWTDAEGKLVVSNFQRIPEGRLAYLYVEGGDQLVGGGDYDPKSWTIKSGTYHLNVDTDYISISFIFYEYYVGPGSPSLIIITNTAVDISHNDSATWKYYNTTNSIGGISDGNFPVRRSTRFKPSGYRSTPGYRITEAYAGAEFHILCTKL